LSANVSKSQATSKGSAASAATARILTLIAHLTVRIRRRRRFVPPKRHVGP
jgi:hypothetical protein